MGLVQALHNVTTLTRATTVSAFQTLSYISEGCIFIYLGLDTLDPIKWQVCRVLHGKLHDTLCSPMAVVSCVSSACSTLVGCCKNLQVALQRIPCNIVPTSGIPILCAVLMS